MKTEDRQLSNEDLERRIIASVMVAGKLEPTHRSLSTDDFYFHTNKEMWGAICELDEEGQRIDPIEVQRICARANPRTTLKLADVAQMVIGVPAIFKYEDIKDLRSLSTSRRLEKVFDALMMQLGDGSVAALIERAESMLAEVKRDSGIEPESIQRLCEVMEQEVFPRLDKFVSGDIVKIPFGFKKLDEATNGGTGLGELVILAAKPKRGKSFLTLQIARHQAENNIPTLIVSREMLNYENGFRFLAQTSGYSNSIFRPNMMEQAADRLKEAGRAFGHLPMWLDDKSKKVSEIRRIAKLLKETDGLTTVFVDYAQLVRPDSKKNNRAEDLEAIYYDLKEMAQDLELAVFLNAQFNREGINSDRPRMFHLDGSSAAEKAGNLILIWELAEEVNMDGERNGKMWIEAGRNVATDEFHIKFDGPHGLFEFMDFI